MRPNTALALAVALALALAACGDDDVAPPVDAGTDAGGEVDAGSPDAGMDAGPEDAGTDAGTDAGPPCDGPPGLYADPGCSVLAAGVLPYNPQFWLWSDDTDKDRFIAFPEDTIIDTRDPDSWVFPVGTRIWKNFSLEGTKLETRLFEKVREGVGIATWSMRTFMWDESQVVVTEVMDGATDVLGTYHDIPPIAACPRCHAGGGSPDMVLGFGAIQLAHGDTETSLADLDALGLLSNAIPEGMAAVPGDAVEREALGYLHSNCGPCHGGLEPAAGMNLWLDTGLATVEASGANTTAVDQPSAWVMDTATVRVRPGNPEGSTLFRRMGLRDMGVQQMPPLASDMVDPEGREIIETWITALGE